ncbi:MAG: ABC transporter ATP-binding protein [Anaerolineales bacterium]|nr:ABC transporter ATP-binding protein [Anaerolineales bacterium]MCB9127842.1 ABC transporter ATP-binding protein [Ardenticatenales bacterium]MCB9172909.1 ABC transporter ATP-binding protein [Ardenticatenales bacterium]
MALLEIENLHTYYGNIHALKGISLEVEKGEVVCLIGSNGAGKSTTLKTVSGLIRPRQGTIRFEGEEVIFLPAHEIARGGVVHVPEGRRCFAQLSVEENLELGAYSRNDKAAIREDLAHVYELFPRLKERRKQYSGTLSGGEQQMLAMGRGLMARPRVLLLDEPSMGLAPVLVDQIFEVIKTLHDEGTTILLVEQNAHMALQVADRGYVIQTGEIVLSDDAKALQHNEMIQRVYLGLA